jgi:hypothetical protein
VESAIQIAGTVDEEKGIVHGNENQGGPRRHGETCAIIAGNLEKP